MTPAKIAKLPTPRVDAATDPCVADGCAGFFCTKAKVARAIEQQLAAAVRELQRLHNQYGLDERAKETLAAIKEMG